MTNHDLNTKIKHANRSVYNRMSPEQYDQNESIFNEKRKAAHIKILKQICADSGDARHLDIGCGTGNLLRIASRLFKCSVGVDIGEDLLAKIQITLPNCRFCAADAESLPFASESFNCVSCHAVLHHLYQHDKVMEECHRLLKKGGTLYTDHDPNYFFNRFYHIWYKIRYGGKGGFGSAEEELAEYHNTNSPGINPEKLKKLLLAIGFSDVTVIYRLSDNEHFTGTRRLALQTLRLVTKVLPLPSFYTHFTIVATK